MRLVTLLLAFFSFVLCSPDLLPRTGTFTNALNSQKGADPCMRWINGTFFLTSTQNTNIVMRAASTVEGLKNATATVLYSDTTSSRNFDFWAPEFWYLDGTWYIYYAVAGNGDDNTHRIHVLRGGTDPNNPMSVVPFTYVTPLIPSNFNSWAVDGNIVEIGTSRYLVLSGNPNPTVQPWIQCLYLTPMSNPTTLSGPAVQISCPTFAWEKAAAAVMEGPEAITINGVTHIVYSASHCSTDDYALGMITLNSTDPLSASSWNKTATPLFTRNNAAGVYGPGHHFMFSKGTEWYFAYHGKAAPNLGCGDSRTTRVQPFTISNNAPVFPTAVATGVPVAEP